MLISFLSHTIEVTSLETENELKSRLMTCTYGSLLLGEDTEDESKFYLLTVSLDCGRIGSRQFGLGICSEQGSLAPHLLLLPEDELMILGFNKEAVGIRLKDGMQSFRLVFDSLLSSFLYLPQQGFILGIHEIGVIAFTKTGQELWRYDKDVVTEYFVEKARLNLRFMDSPSVSLLLSDGRVVS
ncbi:MAG: hypothetical protein AB7H86_07215 [Blastocatellales bacterium]